MAQIVIHEHDREHRLHDGRRPQSDARIVSAGGHNLDWSAVHVNGVARNLDARGWLERHMRDDVLARRYAAEDTAGVVAAKAVRRKFVAMFAAALADRGGARADVDSLHGVDAHERVRDVGI